MVAPALSHVAANFYAAKLGDSRLRRLHAGVMHRVKPLGRCVGARKIFFIVRGAFLHRAGFKTGLAAGIWRHFLRGLRNFVLRGAAAE
jgi:hypothetical protein